MSRSLSDYYEYYRKMRELYLNTEKQFLEFNEAVPYETNSWEVNSPRLYVLLITTCGQVEALMKKICEIINLTPQIKKFPEYYKILNSDGMLEKHELTILRTGKLVKPFNSDEQGNFWWASHNEAKHELPEGILKGTMKNVIYALAAVLVLQKILLCIDYDEGQEQKVLNSKLWLNHTPIKISNAELYPERYSSTYDSKLFIHNTEYYDNGL